MHCFSRVPVSSTKSEILKNEKKCKQKTKFFALLSRVPVSDLMLEKVEILCQLLDIMSIERSQLTGAAELHPYDYEDAVQYLSSLPSRPDVIITRDKIGFNNFGVLVMTPAEFVQKAKNSNE